jgi:hypothetical protein
MDVLFFWSRYQRAVTMDMANKINGLPTYFWVNAEEWISAYKNTLSKNKQTEFDKEWVKLDKQLERFQNGEKGAISPFKY